MLQNRVNPWGVLCAVGNRGTLMGNRGILHDKDKRIIRSWAHQGWVICQTSFKGIQRPKPFSTLNSYSELFFLDEATAFAAGHRPCCDCNKERYKLFKKAWTDANCLQEPRSFLTMKEIDRTIHSERAARGGGKVTFEALLDSLPIGTMFELNERAFLVTERGCLPWSFSGYGEPEYIERDTYVKVLTPRSVVSAFKVGFTPNSPALC